MRPRILIFLPIFAIASTLVACSGSSGFNDPQTLAAAVHGSVQNKLGHPTNGTASQATKVTGVDCRRNGRSNSFACLVHLNTGSAQAVNVVVASNGGSYAITNGQF